MLLLFLFLISHNWLSYFCLDPIVLRRRVCPYSVLLSFHKIFTQFSHFLLYSYAIKNARTNSACYSFRHIAQLSSQEMYLIRFPYSVLLQSFFKLLSTVLVPFWIFWNIRNFIFFILYH